MSHTVTSIWTEVSAMDTINVLRAHKHKLSTPHTIQTLSFEIIPFGKRLSCFAWGKAGGIQCTCSISRLPWYWRWRHFDYFDVQLVTKGQNERLQSHKLIPMELEWFRTCLKLGLSNGCRQMTMCRLLVSDRVQRSAFGILTRTSSRWYHVFRNTDAFRVCFPGHRVVHFPWNTNQWFPVNVGAVAIDSIQFAWLSTNWHHVNVSLQLLWRPGTGMSVITRTKAPLPVKCTVNDGVDHRVTHAKAEDPVTHLPKYLMKPHVFHDMKWRKRIQHEHHPVRCPGNGECGDNDCRHLQRLVARLTQEGRAVLL